ncbi:C40 family peptidase [Rhodococcus sp. HNM0569]|uniref:C40 family peptidase n=1 Tax=Rhodococcus sp. HNM0569 TaxID=2716340 RepID=UPI00146E06F6|nr:C40 family peptidase [Rhodococcus sp. HNM0569]NLU81840.1 C40 family peptidase [Rhodococcus sp. HNM0569]
MIDALAAPILQLLGSFGSGVMPTGGPSDALTASSAAIDAVHDTGRTGVSSVYGAWQGDAGTGALVKTEEAQRAAAHASDRGNDIAVVLADASEIVRAGTAELQAILRSFVDLAVAAGPVLFTPAGQAMLVAAALDHLSRATAVVTRVRGELSEQTAKMTALAPADAGPEAPTDSAPATTAPAASTTAASAAPALQNVAAPLTQAASSLGSSGTSSMSGLFGASSSRSSLSGPSRSAAGTSTDPRSTGEGVELTLPDGSTAVAPNKEAAEAVRNALSQQGVPYVWGGTSPGEGLDCSGLTQWAYGEAGVGLPRLAQEQNVGVPVDQSELMPGDLAVWDGHVAMVIGNGQLVEAGDPVQTGPIRTSNSGMAFKGFYRPTE